MIGSLENKITWEELAPSVQEKFKKSQSDITKLEDDLIAHIENAKANEAVLLKEIESMSLEDFDLEGAKGQVVRTDVAGGQLYADDNFYLLRAITSPITMDDVKWLDIITLKEVCETWERRSWGSQFGSNDLAGAKNSWKYRDDLKAIANRGNWNSVGSFGSTQKYDEFWIKMSMNSVEPDFVDDDWIGYIPVYLSEDESPDGKLHTIMVGRVGNADGQWGSTYPGNFCLIYDFGKSTQIILDYVPRSVFGNTRWKKGWYTSLYVYRKGGYIRAESSNPQQTRDQTYLTGPGEFINWRMPKTKPANWPQESYDIIKFMMDGPAKIGFWTCSNDCLFYLDDQMRLWRSNGLIVDFNTIYDYDFKTGTYKNPRTLTVEDIPLRSFIYNDTTEQFYWYKQPGEFVDIKKSFIVDPTNPPTTNGPFSLVDSNYDEYDGHVRYYRVYTNGWCEQGGYFTHIKNKMSDPSLWVSNSRIYVKFKIPFKDTNYLVTFANHASGLNNISNIVAAFITPKTDRMLCGNDTNSEGSFYHVEGYVDLNSYKIASLPVFTWVGDVAGRKLSDIPAGPYAYGCGEFDGTYRLVKIPFDGYLLYWTGGRTVWKCLDTSITGVKHQDWFSWHASTFQNVGTGDSDHLHDWDTCTCKIQVKQGECYFALKDYGFTFTDLNGKPIIGHPTKSLNTSIKWYKD